MKSLLLFTLSTALLCGVLHAQQTSSPGGNDLSGIPLEDRLLQEHLARRAALAKLRQETREAVAKAKNEGEKKALLTQLERDERPLREQIAQAARARAEAEKARKDKHDAGRPRG